VSDGDGGHRPLSPQNPRLAQLRRLLRRRSSRLEHGTFAVEGPTLVLEALASQMVVREVYVAADGGERAAGVAAAAAHAGVRCFIVDPGGLERIGDTVAPQPAIAVVEQRTVELATIGAGAGPVLVLAEVADPGNAGTLVRTAEAAGVTGVVSTGGVDLFNPKVVRAAAGSLFRLAVCVEASSEAVLDELGDAGWWRVGTDASTGVLYDEADLTERIALVVGNEAHGLDASMHPGLDEHLRIPMTGDVESLNVAVAGAIVLFEAARQRRAVAL
jgi:TrmH family RNA methyltransferase